MREVVTAGAVPAAVASDRSTLPAHGYWRARTLRTQLLSLFILIEVIAAVVAGAVTIFKARTATRVEIAASMELAELVGEGGGLPGSAGSAGRPLSGRPVLAAAPRAPRAYRGEGCGRQRARGSSRRGGVGAWRRRDRGADDPAALAGVGAGAGLVRGADRAADRAPRGAGRRQRASDRFRRRSSASRRTRSPRNGRPRRCCGAVGLGVDLAVIGLLYRAVRPRARAAHRSCGRPRRA